MQINLHTFNLSELNPAPYNPRKNINPGDRVYDSLKRSIEAFGLLEPIIVNVRDGANTVVGGHQRLKVLLEQGVKQTDCVVVDFDPDTEKAANLALNKIENEFDFPALADLLLELDSANFDLDLTGFDSKEVEQMMSWTRVEEEPADSDVEAETTLERNECPKCHFTW